MTRIVMLNIARQLAREQVNANSALSDTRYLELQELPENEALELLAQEFLQDAADCNFGK